MVLRICYHSHCFHHASHVFIVAFILFSPFFSALVAFHTSSSYFIVFQHVLFLFLAFDHVSFSSYILRIHQVIIFHDFSYFSSRCIIFHHLFRDVSSPSHSMIVVLHVFVRFRDICSLSSHCMNFSVIFIPRQQFHHFGPNNLYHAAS